MHSSGGFVVMPTQPQMVHPKLMEKAISTKCNICRTIVDFEVPIKERPHYPFSFIYYHGYPAHAIIVYLDSHYKVRGSEVAVEFGGLTQARPGNFVKKVLVVGDWGVGKTSLVELITHNRFAAAYDPTLTFGIQECTFALTDQTNVKVGFWEAAGQSSPRNDMLRKRLYPASDAALILCDVTRPQSFERIADMLKDIKLYAGKDCFVTCLVNKTDLTSEREVSAEELKVYSQQYHLPFYEISVKERSHLDEFLAAWLKELVQRD